MFNPFTAKFRSDITLDKVYSNLFCDQLHIKFCKFILGAHKKSTNFAILSELGRFPLHFDVTNSMIKYWYRLENLGTSFPLLQNAYKDSKTLFESKFPSWYGALTKLLKQLEGVEDLRTSGPYSFKVNSKKLLRAYYLKLWKASMMHHSSGKLCTYSTFKANFGLEKYLLLIKNFEQRRCLTRFRISAHRLHIERGRYQGTPRHERTCLRCSADEIDDERHFLFSCTSFQEERKTLNKVINESWTNIANLTCK